MKKTILGGILLLAPLAVLALIVGKVFEFGVAAARPLAAFIPIKNIAGIAILDVVAGILILLVCYFAGVLARSAFVTKRLQRLDELLIELIPPYAVFKSVFGSASGDNALGPMMTPVLVRFDDYEQIAFEIEKNPTRSVVFLPGAPYAWSGTAVIVEQSRVTYLNIPTYQANRLMRVFGRGTLALQSKNPAETGKLV